MSMYIRRLVSGGKSRHRDDELGMELDLAYVTDNIIVMGFPAAGLESIYRNRRADVQRFLSMRHGQDFWVFNFCPISENSYDEGVFHGRVSRYPFPDHNVPPFRYMELVTKEMRSWLSGSDSRIAVLHCKAGKGRSGTLACAYLLACSISPQTPEISPRRTVHIADLMSHRDALGPTSAVLEDVEVKTIPATNDSPLQMQDSLSLKWSMVRTVSEPPRDTFEQVLDLYTSRRMKPTLLPVPTTRQKLGVSIPSQQRWLRYWSQFLASGNLGQSGCRKVRLTQIVIRMQELSGIQPGIAQAVSVVKQTTSRHGAWTTSNSGLRVSLARYDDSLVDTLANYEEPQRSKPEDCHIFNDDKWDKGKMVHKFASMIAKDVQISSDKTMGAHLFTFTMASLPQEDWTDIHVQEMPSSQQRNTPLASSLDGSTYSVVSPLSEAGSENDFLDIVVHANRELRLKIFWGQVHPLCDARLGLVYPCVSYCP
ncbi:hypothetical protein ID866_4241 [Astraeus odoratus]|nr:hypothetical protein ID866_4241 [Astraeus odoratus]